MNKIFTIPKITCIIFVCVGLYILTNNIIKQLNWEKTTGIVVEVKEKKNSSNQFYPMVEFKTNIGEIVKVEINQSSNRFYYGKGEDIPVIYPENDFKKAEINSIGWVYGFPLIFIVLGIIGFMIPSDLWYIS
ncbi:MAG: hypothetical protein MRY83_08870 [Flavobacteriales bacterium]|nr:hypothetical protein [Flavobacteriales bacterium]